jgi:hypothetical protein
LFEDLAALPQLTFVIAKSLSDVDVKFSRQGTADAQTRGNRKSAI